MILKTTNNKYSNSILKGTILDAHGTKDFESKISNKINYLYLIKKYGIIGYVDDDTNSYHIVLLQYFDKFKSNQKIIIFNIY